MSKAKKVAVILVAIFVALLIITFVAGSVFNLIFPPSEASYSDRVVEDIGGDGVVVATLEDCLKVSEENIPDGTFRTALGKDLFWKDAKNITYVDTYGKKGNMIVWKTSPDDYGIFDADSISFLSDYLDSSEKTCFLVNHPEKNAVYGIIIGNDNISYFESQLLYDILGLNRTEYSLTYDSSSYSSPGISADTSSHYHTVVPDRYTLSRTDPGAYYDHYEYGDNYDIDNYLESEGYD